MQLPQRVLEYRRSLLFRYYFRVKPSKRDNDETRRTVAHRGDLVSNLSFPCLGKSTSTKLGWPLSRLERSTPTLSATRYQRLDKCGIARSSRFVADLPLFRRPLLYPIVGRSRSLDRFDTPPDASKLSALMAGAGTPTSPNIGSVAAAVAAAGPNPGGTSFGSKKSWWRRMAPCLAFLAAFSTAMALLLVWSEAAALRRQAFDANMTRDYVLHSVSMDDPQLIAYIRQVQLVPTTHQDPPNATQSSEENYVASLFQGKRDGVYLEYISRVGAPSTTSLLESTYGWRGVLVLTDFRSFFEARKSTRHRKTRVLHACLSTDKDTKEITYHQESEVQVTKLGEGPNSLVPSDDGLPTMRLKCFPLYSVLLAYNATNLDYLSLDSPDSPDGQVLDTIPWEKIRISVVSIRWGSHRSEADTKNLVDKLAAKRYKLVQTTDTGKLIFLYNRILKI